MLLLSTPRSDLEPEPEVTMDVMTRGLMMMSAEAMVECELDLDVVK